MDRAWMFAVCFALVTAGCQAGRQAGLDPFNGRQRVPPPGTGAVGGDPYLSGSSVAPPAATSGGIWPFNASPAAPAAPVVPAAPSNPWPTIPGNAPPAWNGAPASTPAPSSSWWPFSSKPAVATPPTGFPPGGAVPPAGYVPPAAYPSGYPGNPAYRGTQTSPPSGVVPATYNSLPGSSSGWRSATPYEAPPAGANP